MKEVATIWRTTGLEGELIAFCTDAATAYQVLHDYINDYCYDLFSTTVLREMFADLLSSYSKVEEGGNFYQEFGLSGTSIWAEEVPIFKKED